MMNRRRQPHIASMARRLTEAGANYQMRLLDSKYHMNMDEFVQIEWLLSTGPISPEEANRMVLNQIRERVLDPEDTELVSGPAAQTSVSLKQTASNWEGAAPAQAMATQPAKDVDLMQACGHCLEAPVPMPVPTAPLG